MVAGERRWRAAQIAGLDHIPALVREVPDEAAMAMALIENIQREDLNPIEEAAGIQRLIDEFNMTHEQIANALGKSRTTVSNLLRLLALPDNIKEMINHKQLEMGHARALLSLSAEQQILIAKIIIERSLSVRETEDLVRKTLASNSNPMTESKLTIETDPAIYQIQQQLSDAISCKVNIKQNAKGRGKLMINYRSPLELERLYELLTSK